MKLQRQGRMYRERGIFLALALALSSNAFADDTNSATTVDTSRTTTIIVVQPSTNSTNANGSANGSQAKKPAGSTLDNNDSFGRKHLWETSFDKAADANAVVAKDGAEKLTTTNCDDVANAGRAQNLSADVIADAVKKCNDLNSTEKGITQATTNMSNSQKDMATISRVSDAVAVGSVGATAVAQFAIKDDSQQSALNKTAAIEKAAGDAEYVTGATDLALATVALTQASKLSSEQASLNSQQKITNQVVLSSQTKNQPKLVADLKAAHDKTLHAAYMNLATGASKLAAGFLTQRLAKDSEKQAVDLASLSSISTTPLAGGASTAINYGNNNPSFSTSGASSIPVSQTGSAGNTSVGAGSSTYNPAEAQLGEDAQAAAIPGSAISTGSGGNISSLNPNTNNSSAAPDNSGASTDSVAKTNSNVGSMNVAGGTSYRGGGKSSDGGGGPTLPDFSALLGNNNSGGAGGAAGAENSAASSATGINPNELFAQAGGGRSPASVGSSENGISGQDQDIFELVRSKNQDMLSKGRLSGPEVVIQ